MAHRYDSDDESALQPHDPADRENLPGELLGEELVEPEPYRVSDDEVDAEELVDVEELEAAEAGVAEQADVTGPTVDDSGQLIAAESAAQRARTSRPVRRQPESAVATSKGAAAPRARRSQAVSGRRANPVQFAGESVEELKKVVWPNWPTVQQYFMAVLVFVLFVIAYVGLIDLGLGAALLRLFG